MTFFVCLFMTLFYVTAHTENICLTHCSKRKWTMLSQIWPSYTKVGGYDISAFLESFKKVLSKQSKKQFFSLFHISQPAKVWLGGPASQRHAETIDTGGNGHWAVGKGPICLPQPHGGALRALTHLCSFPNAGRWGHHSHPQISGQSTLHFRTICLSHTKDRMYSQNKIVR